MLQRYNDEIKAWRQSQGWYDSMRPVLGLESDAAILQLQKLIEGNQGLLKLASARCEREIKELERQLQNVR